MTCDEAIEKLRKKVIPRADRWGWEAYMNALNEREPVIRELYLNAVEQVHLFKSDPAGWNRWIKKLFEEKTDRTSLQANLRIELYFSECVGAALIQLHGANFDRCDLSPVVIKHADMTGCSFQFANLEGSEFYDCDFQSVSFKGANLRHARLWLSSFSSVDFDEVDLSYVGGDVFFYRGVRLGRTCVKHNTLRVRNYDILPCRGRGDKDLHRHNIDGQIIQSGVYAKFFPSHTEA